MTDQNDDAIDDGQPELPANRWLSVVTVLELENGDTDAVCESLLVAIREARDAGDLTNDGEHGNVESTALTCNAFPLQLKACAFVDGSTLLQNGPRFVDEELWGRISSDAPFSWGDNNLAMVTLSRFAEHVAETLEEDAGECPGLPEWLAWLKQLADAFPDTYVNLED